MQFGIGIGVGWGDRRRGMAWFTFHVDPVAGDDGNDGLTESTAWKTTTAADEVALAAGETVGYKHNGQWKLYRMPGMQARDLQLPASVVNAKADKF